MKTRKKILVVVTSHSTLGNTEKPTGYYLPEVSHPVGVTSFADTQIECESHTQAETTAGRAFNFVNKLYVTLDSSESASAKYYSEIGRSNQLEDSGQMTNRGPKLSTHPDYTVFSGDDKTEEGTISFAVPNGLSSESSGTKFVGYFKTHETDLDRPWLANDDEKMNCVTK